MRSFVSGVATHFKMTRISPFLAAPAVTFLAFLGLSACTTTHELPAPAPIVTPPPPPPSYGWYPGGTLDTLFADRFDGTRTVEVLYATNRAPGERTGCGEDAYRTERADSLAFGTCRINVPARHPVGSVESAPNPRSDPDTYYRVLGHSALDRRSFARVLADGRPDVLVFVHGFNVRFEDAVLRAAQLAYDLKFQGRVVLFSWPAGAPPGLLAGARLQRTYEHNGRNAAASIGQAVVFLRLLADAGRIPHLVVHSMGHQVMVPAVAAAFADSAGIRVGELVLNAPDYPVEDFQRVAPDLVRVARRVTVYCSYNDTAIAASEMRNDNRRLGGCERAEGVDVVNVGEIDAPALGVGGLGHGYYASRPILTDVFQVLLGIDAPHRLFVRKAETNATQDYYLRR